MEKEQIENNILIARFVLEDQNTLERDLKRAGCAESLHYHDDWLWLMPVVDKIESEDYNSEFSITMHMGYCEITDSKNEMVVEAYGETRIEATYDTIVKFIKWFNDQEKDCPLDPEQKYYNNAATYKERDSDHGEDY